MKIYQLINPLTYQKKQDLAIQTNMRFSEKLSYWREEREKERKQRQDIFAPNFQHLKNEEHKTTSYFLKS